MVELLGFEIFRYERAGGQEIVTGLSWDVLLILTFIAFFVFLIHFIVRDILNPADHSTAKDGPSPQEVERNLERQGIDEVHRFTATQRASHWIMAISVFLLMLSGFVLMNPNLTLQPPLEFSWLDIHIIFSIVFIGYIIFHIGHVAFKGTWMAMWIGRREIEDLWIRFNHLIGRRDEYPRQFKYPSAQKFLHLGVTGASIGVVITGIILLRRVPIPGLWGETREFTFLGIQFGIGLGQPGWGLVTWSFVLHDLFAILLVGLVLGHIYFALRPEEWGITKSMITGYVSRNTYAEKYSPTSWDIGVGGGTETPATDGGSSETSPSKKADQRSGEKKNQSD
ncbi:cytochrome b/b6 domain-containing protein [Natronorarus salvus]|uniref:cytochrome b/b6 domain-containing protein n=1 Tax=Natronorarus salvus TaxID=3117733 RepID=UPI002F2627B4